LFKYFLFLPFQHSILVMMIIFDMLWVHLSCEAFMFGSKEKKCFFFFFTSSILCFLGIQCWMEFICSQPLSVLEACELGPALSGSASI
jgi:hypothetical protein